MTGHRIDVALTAQERACLLHLVAMARAEAMRAAAMAAAEPQLEEVELAAGEAAVRSGAVLAWLLGEGARP